MNKNTKARTVRAIDKAIEVAGGVRELGRQLNVTGAAVYQWRYAKRPMPFERALQIEALTGVPAEELRPDVLWAVFRK